MHRVLATKRSRLLLAVVAGLVAVSAAWAAIPGPGGVISACYKNANGQLRLVDSTSECRKSESAISWSQTGPSGPVGATGATGATGPTGPGGSSSFVTRTANSGGTGQDVAAGGIYSASVSCQPGEVATGGGGVSPFGVTEDPLSFVVIVASRPTPSSGTPTGWSVTFKNVDTTGHILGHVIYVVCAS